MGWRDYASPDSTSQDWKRHAQPSAGEGWREYASDATAVAKPRAKDNSNPSFLVGVAKGAGKAIVSPFTEAVRVLGEMYPEVYQAFGAKPPVPEPPPEHPGREIALGLAQNLYVPTPVGPVSPVGLGMSVKQAVTAGRPINGQPPNPEQIGERIGGAGVGAFFSAPGAPKAIIGRAMSIPAKMSAAPPEPGPVERVLETIKSAEPLRTKQEAIYSQERGQKAAKAKAVGKEVSGEKGFYAELGQLKGQLPRVPWKARDMMVQADVDQLFKMVAESPDLKYFETISARRGLQKLLGYGELPTQGELGMLGKVFGDKFVTTVLEHRPKIERLKELGYEIANVPRSLMASFDLSAPLRQGLFIGATYPKSFAKAFGGMFGDFASEKNFRASMDEIASRPSYALMKRSGLALTEVGRFPSAREEQFLGAGLSERIPLVGAGVRASNRAYSGFLNRVRADAFDSLVRDAQAVGRDPSVNPKVAKSIANFVNDASGRGGGKFLRDHMQGLNALFFSPRFIASRVSLLNPKNYVTMDPVVRRAALRGALSLGSAALTTLSLAKLAGADVETDPRKADFAKIKIGNTRYDILGGFQQFGRFAATMAMGPEHGTRWDTLSRFAESKTAPLVSFAIDAMRGKNMIDQDFNLDREVVDRFVPMAAKDAYDLIKDRGAVGAPMAIPGTFGVGLQTYADKKKRLIGAMADSTSSLGK